MDRHLKLGIAAALMAAPAPALAQTWPAGAATSIAHEALTTPRPIAIPIDAPVWREPPREVAASIAPTQRAPAQTMPSAKALGGLPQVKVPSKPEWTDNQGFRLHYAEITYRQRF